MMTSSRATAELITVAQMVQDGLLRIGPGCRVHPTVAFLPADVLGTLRPIVLGGDVTVGAYAVLHGGVTIGDHGYIGHHTILGEPEFGYAVRERHHGVGGCTILGTGVVIRAGAIVYAGTTIGDDTTIGHHTLLRTAVSVGAGSQLAANLTVERGVRIGSGDKYWVSRLTEAAAFVVFLRDPHGDISAVIVDADDPRIDRQVIEPSGLSGWSWGVFRLHDLPVDPVKALLGAPGSGLNIFHRHFARFRPLVTATALGTAAGVHGLVAGTLVGRLNAGTLPRVRDNALIALGRAHAEITAALLATLTASRLAAADHPDSGSLARLSKAAGVDTAVRAVHELAPLIGAAGFQLGHPIAKARADLTGLLYADGIHDSLYRSGGARLLNAARARRARVETAA
jgi:acetyltransferase-like isoleucine patch superfamily enzyme